MQDPHFELVRRFGTRIHWIEGLLEEAIYCPENDVAFVRAGLDEAARRRVSAWVLGQAMSERVLDAS